MVVTTVMSVAVTKFINMWGTASALITFMQMESISLASLKFVTEDLRRLNEEGGLKSPLIEKNESHMGAAVGMS